MIAEPLVASVLAAVACCAPLTDAAARPDPGLRR